MPNRIYPVSDAVLEENRRLAAEVDRLRERVAALESTLSFQNQLLELWNRTHAEHERRLAREFEHLVRGPVGRG